MRLAKERLQSIQSAGDKLKDYRSRSLVPLRQPSPLSRWVYLEATPNTTNTWREAQAEHQWQKHMFAFRDNFISTIILAGVIGMLVLLVKFIY